MKMPEEINRILTDRVSSLLLCPSILASDNLLLEGYENFDSQIEVVGDVMEDVAKYYSSTVEWDEEIAHDFGIEENKYVLFTCHRAENTDDSSRMDEIIRGLNTVSKFLPVVWPLHPRLKSKIIDYNLSENIHIIEPLGYSEMVRMIKYCSVVATDSGGLQKEAYYFGKYCITLRDETEWNELVDNNFNFLVGANAIEFERRIKEVIMKTFNSSIELYGGGKAAVNSSQVIQDFLSSLKND
jgi:UDP-GlcNAc3NAcA epimerase